MFHSDPLKCSREFDADVGIVQMADLKENIEDEIHAAHDQYLKMDSHVNLYMNEVEHLM